MYETCHYLLVPFNLSWISLNRHLRQITLGLIVAGTTREQLGFALCLQVPIIVVVTKTDCCRSALLEKNVKSLENLLKSPGSRKIPTRITNTADAVNVATRISNDWSVANPLYHSGFYFTTWL